MFLLNYSYKIFHFYNQGYFLANHLFSITLKFEDLRQFVDHP